MNVLGNAVTWSSSCSVGQHNIAYCTIIELHCQTQSVLLCSLSAGLETANCSELVHGDASRMNDNVFGGRLPADLQISWNAHLKTTAGLTHYSRISMAGQAPR